MGLIQSTTKGLARDMPASGRRGTGVMCRSSFATCFRELQVEVRHLFAGPDHLRSGEGQARFEADGDRLI